MKKKLSITHLILIIAPLFFSCRGTVKEVNKSNVTAGSVSGEHIGNENYFVVDTKESEVIWKGSGPMGSHTGYVSVLKGKLAFENSQFTGGTVEVDMNTIRDEAHRADNNLIDHLKNPDFFDVKKFPVTTIVINKVASINAGEKTITGNLTIKGITRMVSFPAKMEVKDGIVKASGKLIIDRTDWDIRYSSGKFFDNLKDQAIADSIEFNIKIVAKK